MSAAHSDEGDMPHGLERHQMETWLMPRYHVHLYRKPKSALASPSIGDER